MKKDVGGTVRIGTLLVVFVFLLISGSLGQAEAQNPEAKNAQLIVNPVSVRLGVAKVMETDIVFTGTGFEPGDSVFIKLLGVPVNGEKKDLAIASADVEKDGTFTAPVGKLTKISDFLRGEIGENKKGKPAPVISRPPMPPGVYTAQAVSMLSGTRARCTLEVQKPSLLDRLKDWIGVRLGKIIKK